MRTLVSSYGYCRCLRAFRPVREGRCKRIVYVPASMICRLVDAAGAAGLRVQVKTNSSTGMALFVRCADAVPQISLADLLLRTQTPAGTGGATMGAYTAVTAANQSLWTTTVAQHPWQTVTTDVRVQNLFNYDDAITAGTTNYTNTLTYSVVVQ